MRQAPEALWEEEEQEGQLWREKPCTDRETADVKDSAEALIVAAQEQVLKTRTIEAGIYHTTTTCEHYV